LLCLNVGITQMGDSLCIVRPPNLNHCVMLERAFVREANQTQSDTPDSLGDLLMHSAIIAGTFLVMILAPCLVAMRSGSNEKDLD